MTLERWNLHHTRSRVTVRMTPQSPSGPVSRLAQDVISAALASASPILSRLPAPGPKGALSQVEGMLTALALLGARMKSPARDHFVGNLLELPEEVLLYWWTGCFHGYRQGAFRAALRALLTTPDDTDGDRKRG